MIFITLPTSSILSVIFLSEAFRKTFVNYQRTFIAEQFEQVVGFENDVAIRGKNRKVTIYIDHKKYIQRGALWDY